MRKAVLWFLFLIQLFCFESADAQSKQKRSKKKPKTQVTKTQSAKSQATKNQASKNQLAGSAGQSIKIKADTAIAYSRPDFDGDAIAYLSNGETVRASKRTYGSVTKFYKVRLPNGKFGYVSTIDVVATKANEKDKTASGKAGGAAAKPLSRKDMEKQRAQHEKRELAKPMMLNKWYGLLIGQMAFSEKTSIGKKKADVLVYGLKLTGPDLLLEGPILDINLFFHFGAPEYYNDISRVKPTGFLMFADTLFILPFGMGEDIGLYGGIGPLIKYTNFKYITSSGAQKSASSYGIGGSFALGGAYRFGAFSVRLEGKYILEKSSQTVFQLGLQTFY